MGRRPNLHPRGMPMRPASLFRLCVCALSWAVTPWVRAGEPPPPTELPVLHDQLDKLSQPEVATECSLTKAGTSVARLSWTSQTDLERQRIDLTVFKDGFDQEIFALVSPLKDGTAARISVYATRLERKDTSLNPVLQSLQTKPEPVTA